MMNKSPVLSKKNSGRKDSSSDSIPNLFGFSKSAENDENLIAQIRENYDSLTPQMKIAARYILNSPYEFALDSLNSLASLINISQSTFVRLAKYFGFKNGQDFQKKIREILLKTGDYSFRIRYAGQNRESASVPEKTSSHDTMKKIIRQNKVSLDLLETSINPQEIEMIAEILTSTETIFLCGVRRVIPLLFAMRYGLSHFHKKVHIISGVGGMFCEEAENISKNSTLFTISYHPYSPEPIDVQNIALRQGAANILMTDSPQHPMFSRMDQTIIVRDAEFYGLRTLAASHTFIQSLTLAVGIKITEKK